ncbi:hypothetical protein A1O1_08450 [Capronia coronata CBS 617.96]|uniref:Uncharacterized protein n=1 Tax=Capronia coronata CBS 617.96 TaxID=1182541 RepID=W9XJC9_9EURO|nr:uncharacterized protein A1O1_08450 [Capronia coronata CBS 617.96]EXJ80308.1 hypothetical protein A1O1_08450 [Capronia coronata CBS 617.96]
MADIQTPTEASLYSTTSLRPEYTVLNGKEGGTHISLSEVRPDSKSTPTPTPTPTSTATGVNGTTSTGTMTITNGVSHAATATETATPTSTPVPAPAAASEERDDSNDPPLFSPALISDEVSASLPEGYTIRPLRRSDYYGGMYSQHNTQQTPTSPISGSS